MAKSPAHRFGQIIGELLEELLAEHLASFCQKRNLFLDKKGKRVGVRSGKKLTWTDRYGNTHDLDFVIEKPSDRDEQGRPIAFVEAAWRRYTKHSRNKVQEITGAVVPVCEVYDRDLPFMGAVLAGKFSSPSLHQLRNLGFSVVYLGYDRIMNALDSVGIEARFDENTPDPDFAACVKKLERLSPTKRVELCRAIIETCETDFTVFFETLEAKLDRHIEQVIVLPLFGTENSFATPGRGALFRANGRHIRSGKRLPAVRSTLSLLER